MTGRATRGLVVVSLESWDEIWRRNQHLVARLLRDDPALRVLFVEPPSDVVHTVLSGHRPRRARGLRRGPVLDGLGPEQLWLYQPAKLLPRRLAAGYDRRRARRILAAASSAGLVSPTLWINDIGGAPLLDRGRHPSLYDVTDDWLAADRAPAERERLTLAEATLLDRCDEVTVCSPALATTKGASRRVTILTNGVDLARYREPAPRPHDLPPGRTAVYVGTLHSDRLDVELCVEASDALDGDGTLVLIGPSALEVDDLRQLREAEVVVLGPRPFQSVPAYLQHADVLVVPHVVNAFTDSLDPLKLYEYLAAGRPVVSTRVAGFRDADSRRVMAVDRANFPSAVAAAATARPRPPSFEPPLDLPTWERQAALMRVVLDRAAKPATTKRPARPVP